MKTNLLSLLKEGTLKESLKTLSKPDRKKIVMVVIVQLVMSLLDLLGVAVMGVLGALAVSGVQSGQPGTRVHWVLEQLQISDFRFQEQVAILGVSSTIILVSKTLFSVFFTRKVLFFLSQRGASISSNLISRLLAQPLLKIQERSIQEYIFSVTTGVNSITLGVIGSLVILVSDISLLFIMSAALFVVDPLVAFSSLLVFVGIGLAIYLLIHNRAQALGRKESSLSIQINEKIVEVISSYRESVVRNRRDFYVREVGKLRVQDANVLAELSFMPNVSKFIIEATVVLGALAISAVQFLTQDASHAVATLVVFLAAGARIAPAVLRVQQSALTIKSSLGVATPTLKLIAGLGHVQPMDKAEDSPDTQHLNFSGTVSIQNVSLTYPGNSHPSLQNINLEIKEGTSVALVGPSGAGKTSLVDVILGVIVPTEGQVRLSGLAPLESVRKWPGAMGYVPQDVSIINGTIRENIALGFPVSAATDELIKHSIEKANLSELVETYPDGIDTQVGERGGKLSGGQRQRLGIARALFTKPRLLVLDEATSALDGESEAIISSTISAFNGEITVLMIAHRLSTVRNADLVIYMSNGQIVAQGTFEEVRATVKDFDKQASLMGL